MSAPIVEVENVSKSFGGVIANRGVSLIVPRGGITGLIRPNGSGKTTLFNSIVGYHPIDSGSIRFEGREISKLRVQEIARIARTLSKTVVFSKPFLLKDVDRILPAGDYRVVTDEELIEGLSFVAYRRVATMIFLPVQSRRASSIEMVTIPLDRTSSLGLRLEAFFR
jgi:ABC-type branched-subunit amino acid transport system ATPase component